MASSLTQSQPAQFTWIDINLLAVEGRGWIDTEHLFDRLPARAKGIVNENIWNLSHDSAGILVHFRSDTPELRVRGRLRKKQLAMGHMPLSGVSGVDLYVRVEEGWHWMASARPEDTMELSLVLFQDLPAQPRDFLLYLPLYNGTDALEVGVTESSRCEPVVRTQKPIAFYGTSIVQGGCASRPGMAYVAILGRRLDWPVINVGFSGQGRAEQEVGLLLSELDPRIFVLDCLPNLQPEEAGRMEKFVNILRERRPTTPIVLVQSLEYPGGRVIPMRKDRHLKSNGILREIQSRLARTDPNIHTVSSVDLIGGDGEGTVDGIHPTDLGMIRMADKIEPVLRRLLAGP